MSLLKFILYHTGATETNETQEASEEEESEG